MQIFKYNDAQLTIFEYQELQESRTAFIDKIDSMLGLDLKETPKQMLDACLKNNHLFSIHNRNFLRNVSIMMYDKRPLTDKQTAFVKSLYLRIRA